MRKNEKHVVTSRSSLIYGNMVARAYHNATIAVLNKKIAKAKAKGEDVTELQEKLSYNRDQVAYFNDEIARLRLNLEVCGDPVTVIQ